MNAPLFMFSKYNIVYIISTPSRLFMHCKYFVYIAFVLNITSHLEDVLTFFFRYFMSPFFFPEVVSLNEKPMRKLTKSGLG